MARSKEFDKELVLDKAIALFSTKGYYGSSMDEVVDYIGISRSSLYDTFGDKRALYLEALHRYRQYATGAMIEMADNATRVLPTLKKIFTEAVNESLADSFFKGCFMINSTVELAPHDKEVGELVTANMQDVEDALTRLIKKGQDSGELPKHNSARAVARFLYNNISGLRVAAKAGADKKVCDDIVKVVLMSLVH